MNMGVREGVGLGRGYRRVAVTRGRESGVGHRVKVRPKGGAGVKDPDAAEFVYGGIVGRR
jgi:hypothetical protein